MDKFKIGDKVICGRHNPVLDIGDKGEITYKEDVIKCGFAPWVVRIQGKGYWKFYDYEMELDMSGIEPLARGTKVTIGSSGKDHWEVIDSYGHWATIDFNGWQMSIQIDKLKVISQPARWFEGDEVYWGEGSKDVWIIDKLESYLGVQLRRHNGRTIRASADMKDLTLAYRPPRRSC